MIELFNSDVMNSIFDTINNKATDLKASMREQLQSIDSESMRNLVAETNFKVSKIFESEDDRRGGMNVPYHESGKGRDSGGYKRYLMEDSVGSSGEETDYQLGDSGDELPGYDEYLPGYAQPSAYINKEELCNHRVTTTRCVPDSLSFVTVIVFG